MKQLQKLVFKSVVVFLCLISTGIYGQKQKKTFSEKFSVSNDAVLDINTSYADIEFETWNNDEVIIEATIELEGASDEEAKTYFENGGIEIMGNSKKVTITTGGKNSWSFHNLGSHGDFHIAVPEMPEMPEFESFDFDFFDLEDLPPMPPVPSPNFDYEAFKKDGEKYLKEWQKNFQKDFGEPYQKKMEEWQKKVAAKQNTREERQVKIKAKRNEAQVARMEKMAEARVKHAKQRIEAHQHRMERHQARLARHDSTRFLMNLNENGNNKPNIFYFNTGSENRNYKVKKTIKVKMPKSTKIKMNVRHGEVKLAENTKNIDATLSHASLLAATIDGDQTMVSASYSPVSVQKWNYGQLRADYSENVDLKEVLNLRLSATSSDVTIDNLSKTAFIKSSFGPLLINSVSNDFETLDVSLQNGELVCNLPKAAFTVYVNGTDSEFVHPVELELNKTTNHGSLVYKGHHLDKNSAKSIVINSKYSEVILD